MSPSAPVTDHQHVPARDMHPPRPCCWDLANPMPPGSSYDAFSFQGFSLEPMRGMADLIYFDLF